MLVDPQQIDPSGATTLDGWEPSPDGRLLAYQLSSGGDEESDALGAGRRHRARRRRSDRPHPLLPRRLAADGSGFYYVRRLRADSPFDRRVYLHRLGTTRRRTTTSSATAATRAPTSMSTSRRTAAGWWSAPRSAPPRATTSGSPICTDPGGEFTVVQQGVDARCHASVAFDGRLYIWTDADAPRGRLCVADPADRSAGRPSSPRTRRPCSATSPCSTTRSCCAYSRHAISEVRRGRPRGRRVPRATSRFPGIGSVLGITASPDGGTDAWIGYTDALTPPAVLDGDGRLWAAAPGTVAVPGITSTSRSRTSADGTPIRLQILAPASSTGPACPPCSTATAGSASAWSRRTRRPRWPGSQSRRGLGGRPAARRRRGGRGLAPGGHARGEAERLRRFRGRRAPPAQHRPGVERSASSAAPTAACWSARPITREPALYDAVVCSAPLLDMVRYERFGLGVHLERRVRHRGRPGRARLAARLLAAARRTRGGRVPARAARGLRFRHPGRPAARPQVRRRAAVGAARRPGGGVVLLRREADVGPRRPVDRPDHRPDRRHG